MKPVSPASGNQLEQSTLSDIDDPPGGNNKKKFTQAEDQRLTYLVTIHGLSNWKRIVCNMPGRTVRQCRERWKYYLEPSINHQTWTAEEESLLMDKYQEFGPSWARMTPYFRNRTDIDLKNRYHRIERSIKRNEKKLNPSPSKTDRNEKASEPLRTFKMAQIPNRRPEPTNILDLINSDCIPPYSQANPAPHLQYDLKDMSIDNLLNK